MEEWDYLDQTFPHVTSEAVADILEKQGFPLKLVPGHDWEWLAMAVRRMVALDQPPPGYLPGEIPPTADAHKKILRLSQQAFKLASDLSHLRSRNLESVAFELMRSDRDGRSAQEELDELVICLERFSSFLGKELAPVLTNRWPKQRGPWRAKRQRELREQRGIRLAPVFEEAFGRRVSVAKADNHTPFMCFYQSMVSLTVGEVKTPDLAAVLAGARKWRSWWKDNPVSYEGVVPGLRLLER